MAGTRPDARPGPAFPVLISKITLPPLPKWIVPRPQLADRLSHGVLGPLTVIVGPVGAGKSALAVEWAHTGRTPGPLAWVSCDGGREPPGIFWSCVVEALRRGGAETPLLSAYAPGSPDFVPGFVARLAADLVKRRDAVVLVLDDFQPEAGSATAEGVAYLRKHAGPALRLIVLSRRDPPLPLHRCRLAGELTEIRTGDLSFSDEEADALLAQHGVRLPGHAVSALTQRTEGWVAGLRLAAMSMAEHPAPERFVAQFAGDDEAVVSYLVEEVLDAQPLGMRRLLLATSVPERVNAELAAELAGQEAGRHFAALVENNSFLQSLGHGWYRCHQMFRDVLRLRLGHEEPDLATELHRRAAAWFGDRGQPVEAMHHATAAGEWRYASSLAVRQLAVGQVLGLTTGRLAEESFRHMPRDILTMAPEREHPELALVVAAAALTRGDERLCTQSLEHAGALLERTAGDAAGSDGPTAEARLTHAVIRIRRERSRGASRALAAAAEAERLFTLIPSDVLAEHPELRALVLSVHGYGELRAGRLKAAQPTLVKALKSATAAGNGELRRACLTDLALLEALRGRFRGAAELLAQAEELPVAARGSTDRSRAPAHVVRAWVQLARQQPVDARSELCRADAALQGDPDPFVRGLRSLVAFFTRLAEGSAPPTRTTIAQVRGELDTPWLVDLLEKTAARACAGHALPPPAYPALPAPARVRGTAPAYSEQRDLPHMTERLSRRELDVLGNLSQMMTTEEIANELYVSVNTVKTHLKSVYRKLGVSQRTAAVRRARELDLL